MAQIFLLVIDHTEVDIILSADRRGQIRYNGDRFISEYYFTADKMQHDQKEWDSSIAFFTQSMIYDVVKKLDSNFPLEDSEIVLVASHDEVDEGLKNSMHMWPKQIGNKEKICLKVNTSSDVEIYLKKGDAAYLTLAHPVTQSMIYDVVKRLDPDFPVEDSEIVVVPDWLSANDVF